MSPSRVQGARSVAPSAVHGPRVCLRSKGGVRDSASIPGQLPPATKAAAHPERAWRYAARKRVRRYRPRYGLTRLVCARDNPAPQDNTPISKKTRIDSRLEPQGSLPNPPLFAAVTTGFALRTFDAWSERVGGTVSFLNHETTPQAAGAVKKPLPPAWPHHASSHVTKTAPNAICRRSRLESTDRSAGRPIN